MNDLKGRYILLHDEVGDNNVVQTVRGYGFTEEVVVLITHLAQLCSGLGLDKDYAKDMVCTIFCAVYKEEDKHE